MCKSNLPVIYCPHCNKAMEFTNTQIKRAFRYNDCIRKCLSCRIGASNSPKTTFIWEDIYSAIPVQLHDNLETTLNNSLNKINKATKRIRFGYSTSEDAFTWIFIRYFIVKKRLDILQQIFNTKDRINEILLWGVPQINIDSLNTYIDQFKKICESYQEKKGGYSEPDLVIITESEVYFVEVKLASKNMKAKKDSDFIKFTNYLRPEHYSDKEKVKESKLYELARNWSIGKDFSGEKSFTLVNLGPKSLFIDDKDLDIFEKTLVGGRFIRKEWQDILLQIIHEDNWWQKEIIDRLAFCDIPL